MHKNKKPFNLSTVQIDVLIRLHEGEELRGTDVNGNTLNSLVSKGYIRKLRSRRNKMVRTSKGIIAGKVAEMAKKIR